MQRPSDAGPYSAVLAQPGGLSAVLAFAAAQFSEIVGLRLSSEGMRITSVDEARSAVLDAHFPAAGSDSVFKSWRLDPGFLELHVHPKTLAKLLAASGAASALLSSLSLSVGPRQDRLTVSIQQLTKQGVAQRSQYDVALLTAESEHSLVEVDPSDFSFSAQCLFGLPSLLADVVGRLKVAGCQEVRLELRPGAATFQSCGPELPIQCSITLEEQGDRSQLCLAVDKPSACTFAFKFFERLALLSKVSSSVLLQMGEDAPLSVVCRLACGGYCRMFLAPVVEEEP